MLKFNNSGEAGLELVGPDLFQASGTADIGRNTTSPKNSTYPERKRTAPNTK